MKQRKRQYDVTIKDARGEERTRRIFAADEATAQAAAIEKARIARGLSMAERQYGKFLVVACVPNYITQEIPF